MAKGTNRSVLAPINPNHNPYPNPNHNHQKQHHLTQNNHNQSTHHQQQQHSFPAEFDPLFEFENSDERISASFVVSQVKQFGLWKQNEH